MLLDLSSVSKLNSRLAIFDKNHYTLLVSTTAMQDIHIVTTTIAAR